MFLIERVNLVADFSQKEAKQALSHVQGLIEKCNKDTKALSLLKEKVTQFCNTTTNFTEEEKSAIKQITQHIQEACAPKEPVETEEMKKITLEIEELSKKKEKLEHKFFTQKKELAEKIQEFTKEKELLALLQDLRAQEEIDAATLEGKENEVIALDVLVESIGKDIEQTKKEVNEINENITKQKIAYETHVRTEKKESIPAALTLEEFQSYIYDTNGTWSGKLEKDGFLRMLNRFTDSEYNSSALNDDLLNVNSMTMSQVIVSKNMADIDDEALRIISNIEDKSWIKTLMNEYTNAETKDSLSSSCLDFMANYECQYEYPDKHEYNLFSPELLLKIGRLSPHNVSNNFIAVLSNEKISCTLEGYTSRENADLVFSDTTKKELNQREYDISIS